MLTRIYKHKWLILVVIISILLAFFRFNQGTIHQDNYVGYSEALPNNIGVISFYESRLLPGLPILIYLLHFITVSSFLAGYVITILSLIGSYILLYKLTGSKYSFLPLVFPPILLGLASLIDTEFPFIFLMILVFYLIKKQKLRWAFLIIGLSIWFRIAGIAVLGGIFLFMAFKKDLRNFFVSLPYFLIPVLVLILYNTHFFGSNNPLYQIFTYEALHPGRISIGVYQLVLDLVRSFRWHWYRIFISGLAYILLFGYLWVHSIKERGLEFFIITMLYVFTLVVNLVPFLENVGRYLAPTIPFFWLIYYKKFKNPWVILSFVAFSIVIVVL